MTVSEALQWAWSNELPKEPASGLYSPPLAAPSAWSSVLRFGELESMIDRQPNRFGCIPFDSADGPHPDALLMFDAVVELADCSVVMPEDGTRCLN